MQTDNSHFAEKINLRLSNLPAGPLKVLDCYAGTGRIWNYIQRERSEIEVVSIEKESGKNPGALPGDNLKYLKSMHLEIFDVIDLDAYGVPFKQLEVLFSRNYKGLIFVTCIQSMAGRLPYDLLESVGYSRQMIKKIPTLFNRNGFEKLKSYLYNQGVREITGYFLGRKNYFCFNIK